MVREGPLRAQVIIICLFPSSALLPATLKNALLELLVTATKTYTKQRSLEDFFLKNNKKKKERAAGQTNRI